MVTGIVMYTIPNTELNEVLQDVQSLDRIYSFDYQSFLADFQYKDLYITDPDIMLDYLIDNNIRYLLLPQIRREANRNTGVYINSTHRLIWFISGKYPNRFRTVHVEGKEEPCEIVEFIR
jgi:hypothetical protein